MRFIKVFKHVNELRVVVHASGSSLAVKATTCTESDIKPFELSDGRWYFIPLVDNKIPSFTMLPLKRKYNIVVDKQATAKGVKYSINLNKK